MKKLTKKKAAEMLHNPPHGVPLTDKQRKYFGFVANAEKGMKFYQEGLDFRPKMISEDGVTLGPTPEELNIKAALLKERSQKRDSVQRVLNTKYPNNLMKQLDEKSNYISTEPEEYSSNYDVSKLSPTRKKEIQEGLKTGKYNKKSMSIYEDGGIIPIENAKSGIHINPANKGKFTATKKKTGKSTEELTHSKNPLTRKRAIFAQNAKKWHKAYEGFLADDLPQQGSKIDLTNPNQNMDYITGNNLKTTYPVDSNKGGSNFGGMAANYAPAAASLINNSYGSGPSKSQQLVSSAGPWGAAIGTASYAVTSAGESIGGDLGGAISGIGSPSSIVLDENLSAQTRAQALIDPISGGILAQREKDREKARVKKFNNLINTANNLPNDPQNRRYLRPEDQIFNPNELYPSYGTVTNYLAKNGKEVYNEGGVMTHWGGYAKPISENPYLGDTIMFKGNTHQQSDGKGNTGIGVTFGNTPVEVENNEPAIKTSPDSLTVFGNMTIPKFAATEIGDEKAKGKKFKNYIKDLSEQENKQGKIQDKAIKLTEEANHNTYFDKLKLSTSEAMLKGSDMKLKQIADKKKVAASIQNAILETAEQYNLDSESLSKGNIKKAKKGTYMKYPDGGDIKAYNPNLAKDDMNFQNWYKKNTLEGQNNIPYSEDLSYDYYSFFRNKGQGNIKDHFPDTYKRISHPTFSNESIYSTPENPGGYWEGEKYHKKGKFIRKAEPGIKVGPDPVNATKITKEELQNYISQGYVQTKEDPNIYVKYGSKGESPTTRQAVGGGGNKPSSGWESFIKGELNRGVDYNELASKGHGTVSGLQGMFPNQYKPISKSTPDDYVKIEDDIEAPPHPLNHEFTNTPYDTTSYEDKNKFKFPYGSFIPLLRPSNQIPLDANQLAGENYALSHNQLEPVPAQLYNPVLEQPYDISLQDQVNGINAQFNKVQNLTSYNPSAQAALASDKYSAISGVLGEQTRLNQAQKAGVYNRNRGTLNDAQLKNLGILDQQYVRQAQAKSATKAVAQQALNSIASKILQNKLENRTLGVYENLYNYRFDNQGRAWNLNAPVDFSSMIDQSKRSGYDTETDADGNTRIVTDRTSVKRNKNNILQGTTQTHQETSRKKNNGGLIKALKSY